MRTDALFSGRAEAYDESRPTYPDALQSFLSRNDTLKDATVADVGAGTGIFSRFLAAFTGRVFAVEPNESMREHCARTSKDIANITVVNGHAEDTTLDDASVDAITVAQAFHWFDAPRFKTECVRVLRPAGQVYLVWNVLGEDDPIDRRGRALCVDLDIANTSIRASALADDLRFQAFFANGDYEKLCFENPQPYTRDAFIGLSLSKSYAPQATDPKRAPFVDGVNAIFDELSDGTVLMHYYRTELFYGRIAP